MTLSLKILRSVGEIGGNCIEVKSDTTRLLLDIGMPLNATREDAFLPQGLDITTPCDGVLISHPHQDHWGLLKDLPKDWNVYCGKHCGMLINKTSEIFGTKPKQKFTNWQSVKTFAIGDIKITPYLTDHSAFDAYMILLEHEGKRILYSGDFRMHGRKSKLVERMMQNPPPSIDALIMEGTNIGTEKPTRAESEIENDFTNFFKNTKGRVFINWSAQNIDRTVSIYRACIKSGRKIAVDLYTADIMENLKDDFLSLPRVGWDNFHAIVTYNLARMYNKRGGDLIGDLKATKKAHSAKSLETYMANSVIMVRPSMIGNLVHSGIKLTSDDAFIWSNWAGYLKDETQKQLLDWFDAAGIKPQLIHTSGHASQSDLIAFVKAINPKKLIPIHGENWHSQNQEDFTNIFHCKNGMEMFA